MAARKCLKLLALFVPATILLAITLDFASYQLSGNLPITRFLLHELPFRTERFSQDRWMQAGWENYEEVACHRGGMVHSLLSNHLIPGQINMEQVETLLGSQEYDVQIGDRSCPAYPLGWCSGLLLDPDSLYTCYDESGQLELVGTYQH
jgi:hypothetical protein